VKIRPSCRPSIDSGRAPLAELTASCSKGLGLVRAEDRPHREKQVTSPQAARAGNGAW